MGKRLIRNSFLCTCIVAGAALLPGSSALADSNYYRVRPRSFHANWDAKQRFDNSDYARDFRRRRVSKEEYDRHLRQLDKKYRKAERRLSKRRFANRHIRRNGQWLSNLHRGQYAVPARRVARQYYNDRNNGRRRPYANYRVNRNNCDDDRYYSPRRNRSRLGWR